MQTSSIVYRHVLEAKLADRSARFTENDVARKLGMSPNSVSISIRRLAGIGAASIYRRYFEIIDFSKALAYWAATRKLNKDILYSTYVHKQIRDIESGMPSEIAFTAYSGYVNLFGNDASDYSEVYVYATESGLNEVVRRFPKSSFSRASTYANVIVLKPDKVLAGEIDKGILKSSSVPMTQLYVDLWNINTWYAYEFTNKLKKRMDEEYAKTVLQ